MPELPEVPDSKMVNDGNVLRWKVEIPFLNARLYRSDIMMDEEGQRGSRESLYMKRWIFEYGPGRKTKRLHVIYRADGDNCLHDHPWDFWTLVLWGGYVEEVPNCPMNRTNLGCDYCSKHGFPYRKEVVVLPGTLNYRPIDYKHRIVRLLKRFSVTLLSAGPLEQKWGFHTNHGKEHWKDFIDQPTNTRVGWCAVDTFNE